jgi:hypothetical protein
VAEVDLGLAVDAAVFKAAVVDALLVAGALKGLVGFQLPLSAHVEEGLLAVEGEALGHAACFGVFGAGACEVVLWRSLRRVSCTLVEDNMGVRVVVVVSAVDGEGVGELCLVTAGQLLGGEL